MQSFVPKRDRLAGKIEGREIIDLLEENITLRSHADGMEDVLEDALLQIGYLHDKFKSTGSGNNVVARIKTSLESYKKFKNETDKI